MDRLVLDPHGANDGEMRTATEIADDFLGEPGQDIVRVYGRIPGAEQTRRAQGGGLLNTSPYSSSSTNRPLLRVRF